MSVNEHRMFRLHTKHHCSFHLYDKRPFFIFGGAAKRYARADGSSIKITADGSAVRTSLVASDG